MLIACVDACKGFADTINAVYLDASCIVHCSWGMQFVEILRWKDYRELTSNLKAIYSTICRAITDTEVLLELAGLQINGVIMPTGSGGDHTKNWRCRSLLLLQK